MALKQIFLEACESYGNTHMQHYKRPDAFYTANRQENHKSASKFRNMLQNTIARLLEYTHKVTYT